MRKLMLLTVIAMLGASSLGACSGTPASTPAEDATVNVVQSAEPQSEAQEEPEGPSEAEIEEYFDKLATGDPKVAAEAAALAAPDSNAFAYATYLAATYQAARDGGFSSEKSTVNKIDGGFEMCAESLNSGDPCSEYTNIQHVGDKIADFNAGGEPLAGRISMGSGEAQPLGDIGEATLIASYKSISGYVVAVFDVKSSSEGLWLSATYMAPDGRQSQSTMYDGPNQLANGAFGTFSFMFEGAEYGGSVILEPFSESSYDVASTTFALQ